MAPWDADGQRRRKQRTLLFLAAYVPAFAVLNFPIPFLDAATQQMGLAVYLLALPAITAVGTGRLWAFAPELVLPIAFYLPTLHSPMMRMVFGGRPLTIPEELVVWIGCLGAFLIAPILHFSTWMRSLDTKPKLPDLSETEARVQALAGYVATLIGFGFFGYWVLDVGIGAIISASYAEIYLLGNAQTSVTFAYPFIFGGIATSALGLARWPSGAPAPYRLANVALLLLFSVVSARLGMRGPILELLLIYALVRAITYRPLPFRQVLLIGTISTVFFFVISAARQNLATGFKDITTDDVSRMAANTSEVDAPSEFDNVFDNHAEIVRLVGVTIPFRNGETYVELPLQLLPRQLVPNKPEQLSTWWIRQIDPVAADQGAGRAFGSVSEGYLNFGPAGAVLHVAGVTGLLLMVYRLLSAGLAGIAPASAAVIVHSYHIHRSELLHGAFTTRNSFIVAGVALLVYRWLLQVPQVSAAHASSSS